MGKYTYISEDGKKNIPINFRNAKQVYGFFIWREALLGINTSGLYTHSQFKQAAGDRYNAERVKLIKYERWGLIKWDKKYHKIKLVRPDETTARLKRILNNHRETILSHSDRPYMFAGIVNTTQLRGNASKQMSAEYHRGQSLSDDDEKASGIKIKSERALTILKDLLYNRSHKFPTSLKSTKHKFGVSEGVNMALSTVGRITGNSKSTATGFYTVKRLEKLGLVSVKRQSKPLMINGNYITSLDSYRTLRRQDEFRGRLFMKGGIVYERLCNAYGFAI